MKALAHLCLSSMMLLTACDQMVTKVVYERPQIPAELLTCSPEPAKPPQPRTEKSRAVYIAELASAGRDCRHTVEIDLRCWNQDPASYKACAKARREAMGLGEP